MSNRSYYSNRTGKNPLAYELALPILLNRFKDLFQRFSTDGYFQEAFGYECVDDGHVPGLLGFNIGIHILYRIRKLDLWPIDEKCLHYSEDDIFDVIEFLFDHVSRPVDGKYHKWNNCGWHYESFDSEGGRTRYLKEINELLDEYKDGYELSAIGEILALPEKGLETLLKAPLPTVDPNNIESRVESAILKFRRQRSSLEDRRDAIRDLADVLEYLRPKLKLVLIKGDENDMFNIANNFGIRHHNDSQKTDYDKAIWHSWMFYYYLATIQAVVRLIEKHERSE